MEEKSVSSFQEMESTLDDAKNATGAANKKQKGSSQGKLDPLENAVEESHLNPRFILKQADLVDMNNIHPIFRIIKQHTNFTDHCHPTGFLAFKEPKKSYIFSSYKSDLGVFEDNELVYFRKKNKDSRFQFFIDVQYVSEAYYILNYNANTKPFGKDMCILRKDTTPSEPIIWKWFDFKEVHHGAKQMRSCNSDQSLIINQSVGQFLVFNIDCLGRETASGQFKIDYNNENDCITSFEVKNSENEEKLFSVSSRGEVCVYSIDFKEPIRGEEIDRLMLCLNSDNHQCNKISHIPSVDESCHFLCVSVWDKRNWRGLQLNILEFDINERVLSLHRSLELSKIDWLKECEFYNPFIFKNYFNKLVIVSFNDKKKNIMDSRLFVAVYDAPKNKFYEIQQCREEVRLIGGGRYFARTGDQLIAFNAKSGQIVEVDFELRVTKKFDLHTLLLKN